MAIDLESDISVSFFGWELAPSSLLMTRSRTLLSLSSFFKLLYPRLIATSKIFCIVEEVPLGWRCTMDSTTSE